MPVSPTNVGPWSQQSPIELSPSSSIYVPFAPDHLTLDYDGKYLHGQFVPKEDDEKQKECPCGSHAAAHSAPPEHPSFLLTGPRGTRPALTLDGRWAYLNAIHLHTPSEHDYEGIDSHGEIHLVHVVEKPLAGESSLVVLGLPFYVDGGLPVVDRRGSDGPVSLNPDELKLDFTKWYRYEGSLTTGSAEPYPEVVSWVVRSEAVTFDALLPEALKLLLSHAHQHERKTHPLSRRFVLRNFEPKPGEPPLP